ncbi:MAG: hypothetical protein IAF38_08900 [Bacteroidia bacterium]|nr:hypothetical protein [Bacteroidia bacterium]
MKTILFFAATFLLLLETKILGQTNNNLTPQQILDSSISFCGGQKRITNIKTSDLTYGLTLPDKSMATLSRKIKTGQKYMQSILSWKHAPTTIFYDGKKLTKVEDSLVKQMDDATSVEHAELETYNQIQYAYKVLKYKLIRQADKKFEYVDCYVVDAIDGKGDTITNFFDKTNFRLTMVIYPNGDKSIMTKYIFKDSVLFNSQIINTYRGSEGFYALTLYDNIELNVEISDIWFTCPYKDKVAIPANIRTGEFVSTNGVDTRFLRTGLTQEYRDANNKLDFTRILVWSGPDTFRLADEKSVFNDQLTPESKILVRIISWDKNNYVCQWVAGKYTDTQDYKIKK